MSASAPVNISDLKKQDAPREARLPAVSPGFGDLASFELMQRGAKVLSASTLVPKQYQGADGMPNAIIALNMALRMQADPLMVMQNLYVVHGRPAWSAQFLIACFNQCGRYSALRYDWQSERGKDDWGCRAWAIEKETGQRINGPLVTMGTAKAEGWVNRDGSKWKTIPELMLTYRAASWLIRTNAPEIAMGLPTADEAEDIVTLTPAQYSVEQVAAGEHAAPAAAPPPAPAAATDSTDFALDGAPVAAPTYAEVRDALDKARDADAVDVAESLVDSLPQNFRAELHELAKTRRKALK